MSLGRLLCRFCVAGGSRFTDFGGANQDKLLHAAAKIRETSERPN